MNRSTRKRRQRQQEQEQEQPRPDFTGLPASLPPLSFAAPAVPDEARCAYLRYYGIHFAQEFPTVNHYWGMLRTPSSQRLSVHLWAPPAARGAVVLLHGYFDHVGLFSHLLRHLLRRNYAILTFDLPGHGLSSGAAAAIGDFSEYMEALRCCIAAAGDKLPRPRHLLGQSTGAALAMEWLLAPERDGERRAAGFRQVILLAPLVRPWGWGWLRWPHRIARHLLSGYPRRFTANTNDAAFLAFVRDRDPLQAPAVSMQWVNAMERWGRRLRRYPPAAVAVRVIQGRCDRTVDWRYNCRVIRRLFASEETYLDEARHHLVNESSALRERVFRLIDETLQDPAAAPRSGTGPALRLRVALSGGIGSGKSAAAAYFEALGAGIIDADALSHALTARGQPAVAAIEERLGPGLVDADGNLERAKLRRLVFADPHKRKTLEDLLHPLIRQQMRERAAQCTAPYCILVIPLLIESGERDLAERLLVVDAPPQLCIQRVAARDHNTPGEIRRIMAAQATREERLAMADDVLDNSGTPEELQRGVRALHSEYMKRAGG